jgi:DNA-binding GntR family transcriptional regulator
MKTEREKAYKKIRDAIIYGTFKPGEKLIEKNICDLLELGRTPVREAFWQLEKDGFLKIIPNKGAYVPKISLREYEEYAEVAAVLEGYGVGIAAKIIKSEEVEELKKKGMKVVDAAGTDDYMNYNVADFAFHEFFPRVVKNEFLMSEIRKLRHRLFRLRAVTKALFNNVDEFLRDHEKIIHAVAEGNSEEASNAMKKHVNHAKEYCIFFLKENPWFL